MASSIKKKVIIIFSSKHGLTEKISLKVYNSLKHVCNVDIFSIFAFENVNIVNYDVIILGSSIYYGKHNKRISKLVEENLTVLKRKKSFFFSVNVVARKKNKSTADSNPYLIKFFKQTNWSPDFAFVFAGQVNYPVYSFLNKIIIRFIMFVTKGPTDLAKCHDFTNWSKVNTFVNHLKSVIAKT